MLSTKKKDLKNILKKVLYTLFLKKQLTLISLKTVIAKDKLLHHIYLDDVLVLRPA